MKDKKEFVTTIFVQNEPAVIATGTTEDISVSNAIKAFESKGFEAPTVEKIAVSYTHLTLPTIYSV